MSQISRKRRLEILAAAGEEFARCGINAASMSSIAARAGIAKSTIYEYFPSKTALIGDICRQKIAVYEEEIQKIFLAEMPFLEKVESYCCIMEKSMQGVNTAVMLLFLQHQEEFVWLKEHLQHLNETALCAIQQAICQAQATKELPLSLDTRMAAVFVLSLPNPFFIGQMKEHGMAGGVRQVAAWGVQGLAGSGKTNRS